MTRFAIRGLLSRKLRTALTALAIVLGVAMISGTYVLTDSIDQAFDRIFTDIRAGLERRHLGEVGLRPQRRAAASPSRPSTSRCSSRCARFRTSRRPREASTRDATQLIGDDGKAVVYGGAPNLGFSIADGDSPLQPADARRGHVARAGRGRRRQGDRRQGGLRGRRDDRRPGRRPGRAAARSPGSSSSAPASRSAARRSPASTSPTAQRLFEEGRAGSTRSRSPRSPGVSEEELVEPDRGRSSRPGRR